MRYVIIPAPAGGWRKPTSKMRVHLTTRTGRKELARLGVELGWWERIPPGSGSLSYVCSLITYTYEDPTHVYTHTRSELRASRVHKDMSGLPMNRRRAYKAVANLLY